MKDEAVFSPEESRLIWVDCEMTGLDVEHDELCEVSVVPTDFNFNVLDDGFDIIIKPSDAAVNHMNDFVRNMHTSSGLVDEWQNAVDYKTAEKEIIEYVKRFLPENGKIDVSTIKELARRWYPHAFLNRPAKHGGHRALADIIESADELRYYRDMFFAPLPGPDEAASKAGAENVEKTSLLRIYEKNGHPLGAL